MSSASKKQFAELVWLQTDSARSLALDDLTRARIETRAPLFEDHQFGRDAQ